MARKPATVTEGDETEGGFGGGDGTVNFGGGQVDTEDGDGMVVDLTNTGEGGYAAMPAGIYDVTVASLEFGTSQRSGNKMWTWQFEVEGGEFAGRKLFYHTVFSEGGMPRVKRTLARIKCDDNANVQLLNGPFNPQVVADEGRLLGARCRLRVAIRNYEGENRNEVKDVLVPTTGGDGFGGGFAG
jgi:hypothetical protein